MNKSEFKMNLLEFIINDTTICDIPKKFYKDLKNLFDANSIEIDSCAKCTKQECEHEKCYVVNTSVDLLTYDEIEKIKRYIVTN